MDVEAAFTPFPRRPAQRHEERLAMEVASRLASWYVVRSVDVQIREELPTVCEATFALAEGGTQTVTVEVGKSLEPSETAAQIVERLREEADKLPVHRRD